MRALIVFLLVVAGAVLAGALTAYPLYAAASLVFDARFEKVISNTSLLCGLILSLVYLRAVGGWSLEGVGLRPAPRTWRGSFIAALGAGVALILSMEALLLLLGVHELDASRDLGVTAMAGRAGLALLAGLFIGAVEEILFRGALYGAAQRAMGTVAATLLTSAVYAAAHYLKYPAPPAGEAIGWFTWIGLYPTALNWFYYASVYDAMAALFLLGVLLCMLRRRFGHILAGIGLHAGVVAALIVVKYATHHVQGTPWGFLVSRYDNYQGWLACAVLLAAIVAVGAIDRHASLPDTAGPG